MKPPIADPHKKPQGRFEGAETRVFRARFWPYFWATILPLLLAWLIAGALLYPEYVGRPQEFASAMEVILAYVIAMSFVGSACNYWLALLRLNRWGIRAFSFWGVGHQIEWKSITRVKSLKFVLPYAVVFTTGRRKLWIALCLQDVTGFADTVVQFAPADNPLALFMKQHAREAKDAPHQ